jgi:hypothetical protein
MALTLIVALPMAFLIVALPMAFLYILFPASNKSGIAQPVIDMIDIAFIIGLPLGNRQQLWQTANSFTRFKMVSYYGDVLLLSMVGSAGAENSTNPRLSWLIETNMVVGDLLF